MLHGESSCPYSSEYVWQRGVRPLKVDPYFKREKNSLGDVTKTWPAAILTPEPNPPERMFEMYSKVNIAFCQVFVTPPYFCWQLRFYQHLPTLGRQNTVKAAPQPLFVNRAFVAPYVTIISPLGPIPISFFIYELEAEE